MKIEIMTIGIDASRATTKQKTGTEHYAEQIIYHLAKIDHKNQYILFSQKRPTPGSLLGKLPNNFSWKIIPGNFLWTQIKLSWHMLFWKNKLDILFVPSHTIPLVHPQKTVVTIHDFGFNYKPELYAKQLIGPKNPIIKILFNIGARIVTLGKYGNSEYDYHCWASNHSIKNAASLIAVSNDTKQDAVKLYKADPAKIKVIYHGFDKQRFTSLEKSKNKRESEELTSVFRPYIFFVSRLEEKKNVYNMLKAFIKLKQEKKIPHKFLLAGKPGMGYGKIKQLILNQPDEIQKSIVELGYISDHHLPMYLQNADLFFFCTNFEGFGIPVIEAQACGIPVVCSNITSLPEVAGDSACLANPKSVDDMVKKVYKVIHNRDFRTKLIRKGFSNIKRFSWTTAARQTLDVILKTTQEL